MHRRRAVVLVMYDLPVKTGENKKESDKFRKYLIQHGYVFVQKSIYAKLLRNKATLRHEVSLLKREAPKGGIINILPLCIDDFRKMESVSESPFNMSRFADDMIIV